MNGYCIHGERPVFAHDQALYEADKAELAKIPQGSSLRAPTDAQRISSLLQNDGWNRAQIRYLKDQIEYLKTGPDDAPDEYQRLIKIPVNNTSATVAYCPEEREITAIWCGWGWLLSEHLSDAKRADLQSRLEAVL